MLTYKKINIYGNDNQYNRWLKRSYNVSYPAFGSREIRFKMYKIRMPIYIK